MVEMRTLYILNAVAAVFHVGLSGVSLYGWIQGGFEIVSTVTLPVDRTADLPDTLKSTECDGVDYYAEGRGFFEWRDCTREVRERFTNSTEDEEERTADQWTPEYESSELVRINMAMTMFWFSVITAAGHIYLCTCGRKNYRGWTNDLRQPVRWLEYSLSSSVMLVAINSLSQITNLWIVLCYFALLRAATFWGTPPRSPIGSGRSVSSS